MAQLDKSNLQAIVLGVSAGGIVALKTLLGHLPSDFPLPILIVQHVSPEVGNILANLLDSLCEIRVKEADEGEAIRPATVYLAPPNYHLLIELDGTLALTVDAPVCFARPSIDVLFESAARTFGPGLIGVILTGANSDGSQGAKAVKERGGVVVVQDPSDAEIDSMPRAALAAVRADYVVPLDRIASLLQDLAARPVRSHPESATGKTKVRHADDR